MITLINALHEKIRWHRHVRRGRHELYEMDDYLLKDIGISRSQIDYYASGKAERQ